MRLLGALGIDWKIFLIQCVNFLVLVLILKKLFFKKFIAALREEKKKEERIKNGEIELQREKQEMERREKEIIKKAKEKTKQIIEEGEEVSEKEKERIMNRTEEEVAVILKEARIRAKEEVKKMKEEEKREMLIMVKNVVKRVLSRSFTKKLHKAFIDETIGELKNLDFNKIKGKEITQIIAISAFPLEKEEKKEISDFLFSKLKNPVFKEKVDPGLIAGMRILIDESLFLVDGSMESRIDKIINMG